MNGTYTSSVVRLTNTGKWHVYALYDNFYRDPFYIGMAKNVVLRGAQHMSARGPVRDRIKEVVEKGGYVNLMVIGTYDTAQEAAQRERIAIRANPDLVNRQLYAKAKPRPPKVVPWNRHRELPTPAMRRAEMKARAEGVGLTAPRSGA